MKKLMSLILIIGLIVGIYNFPFVESNVSNIVSKDYYEGTTNLVNGTYTSTDGHTIVVSDTNVVVYDGTYTLTPTLASSGNIVSGKVGTNNKTLTLYEINDSTYVSGATMNYSDGTNTVYVYNHTVFKREKTPVSDTNGIFEVYSNGTKTGAYVDLQSAVDAAKANDTIKIKKDFKPTSGAYVNKNLTIDGNNVNVDKTSYAFSLFVVEEGATVTIKDFNVDGGSKHKIDWTIDYPALVAGSADNDFKQLMSMVVSKGNVTVDDFDVKNTFAGDSDVIPTIIKIQLGTAVIKNCDFHHLYGKNRGSAINIGTDFKTVQTKYLVDSVTIENCTFTENFASGGWGGSVSVSNTTEVEIKDSQFVKNMSNGYTAGAGALYFDRNDCTPADKFNLPFIQAYIDNCLFEENYSGNDGYAIQNESAEMTITNSIFRKNYGLAGNSSVGTISNMTYREKEYKQVIKNCVFDGNVGAASVFGDHGTLVKLDMSDCIIKNNEGNTSILLYSADANITNCTFENEIASSTVIDIRSYGDVDSDPLYKPQVINIKDTTFTNTVGPTDVKLSKYQSNQDNNEATVNIIGNNSINIHVWDNNYVNIDGTLTGNIKTDNLTSDDNIAIKDDSKVNGEVIVSTGKQTVIIQYPYDENTNLNQYVYLETDKVYTDKELYDLHHIGKDGYKLEYYTDSTFTTLWGHSVSSKTTLYAKWVEHTHTGDKSYVLYDNAIYEQCECGYFVNKLVLANPENLYYDGKDKPVVVINEIGVKETDYEIEYFMLQSDNTYKKVNTVPKELGKYKAVLKYSNMEIETEYEIVNQITNPETGDINPYVMIAIALVLTIGLIKFGIKKKLF